jgi:hypothetical protein
MEANIVVNAEDLTPDFADGIRKVFSRNAVLHIKVEYNVSGSEAPAANRRGPKPKDPSAKVATPGKKRGPKPKGSLEEGPKEGPKKRGRKPGPRPVSSEGPKKRGPKPKIAAE